MHKLLTTLHDVAAAVAALFTARPALLLALLLLLIALLWPLEPAQAQNLRPIRTVAQNIATALTGPFATAVATIGLVGCGFLAMSGRMPWGAAIADQRAHVNRNLRFCG